MTKSLKSNTDYFDSVVQQTSDPSQWKGLRIQRSIETSNDVVFENTTKNSLTLDHTGTSRHLTKMDSIISNRPTCPEEICQIPAGLSARFAWDIVGPAQRSTMIVFENDVFEQYCPEIVTSSFLGGHLLPKDYACNPVMSALIHLLEGELHETSARGLLYAQTVIRLLALEIATNQWSRKPKSYRAEVAKDMRVKKAVDFIHGNLSTNLSLLDLASASGLKPTRLTQVFKQTTGKRPYEYVVDLRIKTAIRLLEMTELPLCHVALEVGFSDQQHMTHAFQQRSQRTPSSFRKRSGSTELAFASG